MASSDVKETARRKRSATKPATPTSTSTFELVSSEASGKMKSAYVRVTAHKKGSTEEQSFLLYVSLHAEGTRGGAGSALTFTRAQLKSVLTGAARSL
jgi:hypothetical protein